MFSRLKRIHLLVLCLILLFDAQYTIGSRNRNLVSDLVSDRLVHDGISNVRNMSCDGWYSPSSPIPRITSNVRGITVFSTEDHPFTLSSEGALERLHEIALFNATHVGVQVPIVQYSLNSTSMKAAISMESLRLFLQNATVLGLKALIHPIILVPLSEKQSGIVSGQLCLSPSDPASWFVNIGNVNAELLKVAIDTGHTSGIMNVGLENVSLLGSNALPIRLFLKALCGGTVPPLDPLFNYTQGWISMIDRVRREIPEGSDFMLTYSSLELTYPFVSFWSALDAIGIDLYPTIPATSPATLDNARSAWQATVSNLAKWLNRTKFRLPVIVTESGCPSYNEALHTPTVSPSSDCQGHYACNFTQQALYYQAFMEAWSANPDVLHGAFPYKFDMPYDSDHYPGGDKWACGFTPRHKPARDILAQAYRGKL